MRDYALTQGQAIVADQVADIMDAIATASESAEMSDPVFNAWMLGCIHSALTNAHKARLPGEDWEPKIQDIRDDAAQLRLHPRPLRGRVR